MRGGWGVLDEVRKKVEDVIRTSVAEAIMDSAKVTRTAKWLFDVCDIVADVKTIQSDTNYKDAKAGSFDYAWQLSARHLVDQVKKWEKEYAGKNPMLMPVQAVEGVSVNQIPLAMSVFISMATRWRVNLDIVQANRVSHTKSSGWHRLANQALFVGKLMEGGSYLLIDDFIGQGGTFANIKGYIDANGGQTIGAIALGGKAYSARLSLSYETLTALREKYEQLEPWWRNRFGFGFECLTESEGRYLLRAEDADTIRNRMAETAPEGRI